APVPGVCDEEIAGCIRSDPLHELEPEVELGRTCGSAISAKRTDARDRCDDPGCSDLADSVVTLIGDKESSGRVCRHTLGKRELSQSCGPAISAVPAIHVVFI